MRCVLVSLCACESANILYAYYDLRIKLSEQVLLHFLSVRVYCVCGCACVRARILHAYYDLRIKLSEQVLLHFLSVRVCIACAGVRVGECKIQYMKCI